MRIGLVRHFKVLKEYPKGQWLTGAQVKQWFKEYDATEIELAETDLDGIAWERCLASDMPRAIQTAAHIYDGPIEPRSELREIAAPLFAPALRLPFPLWVILIRLSWYLHAQTRADIRDAKRRIRLILDEITAKHSKGNVLIVSHAALMKIMRQELRKRGFRGPAFNYAENGKLYVFTDEP